MGQRETAAPMFPAFFDHPRQPGPASNRHRLSAVCQSNRSHTGQGRRREDELQPAPWYLPLPNTGSDPRPVGEHTVDPLVIAVCGIVHAA